ncbi:MAG: spore cortex biosynthesis protein YabQ [Clostridia bacterium]
MIDNQMKIFAVFILDGLLIGLLFDFFRIIRKTIKTPNIITYIQDIIFWILTGILIIYTIFVYNNGQIRLYMFLAIVIGVLIYFITISKKILNVVLNIIEFMKKVIKLIIKPLQIIIQPARHIYNKIIKNIEKIKNSSKFVQKSKN